MPKNLACGARVNLRLGSRENPVRHPEPEEGIVPLASRNVHQHGSAGVGDISDMHATLNATWVEGGMRDRGEASAAEKKQEGGCPAVPVRFQSSQVSTVPKRQRPLAAASRTDATLSISQRIFTPEK
jgi:hypothetical protein